MKIVREITKYILVAAFIVGVSAVTFSSVDDFEEIQSGRNPSNQKSNGSFSSLMK